MASEFSNIFKTIFIPHICYKIDITFSSSLIHKILLDAHTAGKQFRVIVVDGRPWLEGKEQLRRLAKHGIECSYILITALSYVMPEVSINSYLLSILTH